MPLLPFASPPIQKTAVTPASYTNTNLTVNKFGQITAASNGSGGGSTTININTLKIDQAPVGTSTYGTLAGTVNGTNAVFTVSNGAYVSGSLMVFLNGQEQTQGANDWSETTPASGTFTFTTAPPSGSIIQATYVTQSTASGYQTIPLATVTGINAKSVATTALYTVPAGKTAILTNAIVRCTAASSITNGPTASIGVTSSSFNDIYASANMVTLTTTNSAFGYSSTGIFAQAKTTNVVTLNITNAATGTSQTIAVDIMGYLV